MVLSNKKLKQKLRAAVAESLAESVAETHPSNNESTNTDPNPKSQSLKELLDSATLKPRLSKREKRRKTLSLQDSEVVNTTSSNDDSCKENEKADTEDINHNNNDNKEKKKKRKRDGDGNEGEVIENVKMAKKKKKKQKKSKKKTAKNVEEKKGIELGNEGSGEQVVAETVKISDSQDNGDVATKVYVGGVPYYSAEDDIRSYFESCGTITEVDCMKFPESGKFRGIAIISFKTEAAAKRALALDGSDMGGLFLKVQPYKTTRANKASDFTKKASDFAPEIVEGYNRIYVGNLSWDITEDDLRQLFSDCTISSIRFGIDKETGEFRGYAHVDFSDSLSLTMALKLDQEIVCGRAVKISCAVPKKGAKTHSKSPPSNKADNAGVVPEKGSETHSSSPTSNKADCAGVSSGTGKKKRRTCYECGEPGHISSACPKKLTADPVN